MKSSRGLQRVKTEISAEYGHLGELSANRTEKTDAQAGGKVRSLHRNRRDTMRHIGKDKQTKCCFFFL
jgi:hypothetical protein